MFNRNIKMASLVLVAFLLTSCSSLQQLLIDVVTPELTVVGNPSIVSVEPPLFGSGEVVIRIPIEAHNPNAIGLELTAIDLDLFLEDRKFANGFFEKKFTIGADNRSRFDLDVSVPITTVLWELQTITGLISGVPTRITLDAGVTVKVFDLVEVFAKTQVFDSRVSSF